MKLALALLAGVACWGAAAPPVAAAAAMRQHVWNGPSWLDELPCKEWAPPARGDIVVGYSDLHGPAQPSDTVWHDQEWAFHAHGPLSRFTLLKAWYYDGAWHDPGELKGLQAWYGRDAEAFTGGDALLLGARKPHIGQNFTLAPGEALVKAEVQFDDIMRFINFTTSTGRKMSWGFPGVAGARTAIVEAPAGAYIAAFRGYEGKPLPPELGGYKKRYIAQIGFSFAQRSCSRQGAAERAADAKAPALAARPAPAAMSAAAAPVLVAPPAPAAARVAAPPPALVPVDAPARRAPRRLRQAC